MIKSKFALFCFALSAPLAVANNQDQFALWAKIKAPTTGESKPIGFYSAGCLAGAQRLNASRPEFAVMRPSRRRYFANPDMIQYIERLGEKLRRQKLPVMLVGDLSPPRGGPMRSGHSSHQSGLDADIWLKMSRKRPTPKQRESWAAPSFVSGRKKLKKSWSRAQTKLVATAADFAAVNRIFVSPAIKRYYCDHFASADWLYKLRAWWGHEDHIHVRLNCPADNSQCVVQDPLDPADNGCGAELDWWFSNEADEEWQKIKSQPSERPFPELPAECREMTKDI